MEARRFRVGIAQMDCVLADVEANLKLVEEFVERAASQQVDLLVFPELALSGYLVRERFHEVATRLDSPAVERLRELSHRMSLVVGILEETEDVDFFNSAVYLSKGAIRHLHRKIYLPTYGRFDERRYFGAGTEVEAFDTSLGRLAMLVCGDCWHLSVPYMAVHDGADVLLVLAASSKQGLAGTVHPRTAWENLNYIYALTMGSFVVFANRAGVEEGLQFWGGSQVVLPDGQVAAQGALDEPDLVVADIDPAVLRRQRIVLPFRRDDQLELTERLAARVLKRKARRRRSFVSELEE